MIQAGIEDATLRRRRAVDGRDPKLLIPGRLERAAETFEIPGRYFSVEIGPRLLDADEGGADLDVDHAAVSRVEGDEGADVDAFDLVLSRRHPHTFIDGPRAETLLEADGEISLEVRQSERTEMRVHAVGV